MNNRFFNSNLLSVNYNKFAEAIKNGDSKTIDLMLDAKSKGYELDIEKNIDGMTPLELLLKRGDVNNAGKLIDAGAKTKIECKEWVPDDYGYPYGGWETTYRSVFANCSLTKEDLKKLINREISYDTESNNDKVIGYKN